MAWRISLSVSEARMVAGRRWAFLPQPAQGSSFSMKTPSSHGSSLHCALSATALRTAGSNSGENTSGNERGVGDLHPRAAEPDRNRVGHLPDRPDAAVAPVADGVETPGGQAADRQPMGDRLEAVAILAVEVHLAEVDPALSLGAVEAAQGIALLGEPGEEVLAAEDRTVGGGAHAGDSRTPEEAAIGIDEPPLALVLGHAEASGPLQLRPLRPAAEAVAAGQPGMGGQIRLLLFARGGEILLPAHLPRPLLVGELPVAVHEGLDSARVHRNQLDAVDAHGVVFLWPGHEDLEGHDVRQVEHRPALPDPQSVQPVHPPSARLAAHAFDLLLREVEVDGGGASRGQFHAALPAMPAAVGLRRIVHPDVHQHRLVHGIGEGDGKCRLLRPVTVLVGRAGAPEDVGPGVVVAKGHFEGLSDGRLDDPRLGREQVARLDEARRGRVAERGPGDLGGKDGGHEHGGGEGQAHGGDSGGGMDALPYPLGAPSARGLAAEAVPGGSGHWPACGQWGMYPRKALSSRSAIALPAVARLDVAARASSLGQKAILMAIHLIFSSSVGRLGRALAENVAGERLGRDPFAESLVIVPNPNLAKWLTFELADAHGIAANLSFAYLEDGLRLLLGGDTAPVLDRSGLRQLVVAVLLGQRDDPALAPFLEYCASSVSGGFDPEDRECARRVWQLGGRLATYFEEYDFHRREMVDAWLAGDDACLRRMLAAAGREPTAAQAAMEAAQCSLYARICQPGTGLAALLPGGWLSLPALAGRWSAQAGRTPGRAAHLFGLSQLSRFHCLLLHRLAAVHELYIYHFNVCSEFWEDMTTLAEDRWRAVRAARTAEIPDQGEELELDIENPLLKACGKAGRETVKLLADLEESEHAAPPVWLDPTPRPPATVLEAVQDLVSRRSSRLDARMPQDRTLQVAGCPGLLREIETVHDSIVSNLLDPEAGHVAGLRLTDIAILVPDMPTYRPVIGHVFDGRGTVPYNLVDSSAAEDSVYGRGLLALLDLAAGDFSRKQVFELFFNPCFLAAGGLGRDEVSEWLALADELGIFHDLDADQRAERGLEADWHFTWEQALRRLRLGMALDPAEPVPEDSPFAAFPAAVPPFAGEDAAAGFSLAVRRLGTALRGLGKRKCSGVEWSHTVRRLMASFLAVPEDLPGELQVRSALDRALDSLVGDERQPGLAACLAVAGAPERFGLPLLREFLQEALGAVPSGRGRYLVGGVTIASFLPMRPIPFKVVYIVGLQEGSFPGTPERTTLDLRLARRQLGDVNRTDANRYLFLENLMAVRQRLYLTYANRDLAKDEESFPCSVVNQLLAFVSERVLPEGAEFREATVPLQAADWRCVRPATEAWTDLPTTWSMAMRAVGILNRAGTDAEGRAELARQVRERLAGAPPDAPETAVLEHCLAALGTAAEDKGGALAAGLPNRGVVAVGVEELARFLRDPAAATLRRHLSIRDEAASEALLAEDEPVGLDRLERYGPLREAVAEFAAAGDLEEAMRRLRDHLGAAERASAAPTGLFGELQGEALADTLGQRLAEEDPFAPVRDGAFLREVVFGGSARGDRPPARPLPEVLVPALRVGDRDVTVALSGRVEFFRPVRDGVAAVLVVTDSEYKAANLVPRGQPPDYVPGYQVLAPLLFWSALRMAGETCVQADALDVFVAYRKDKGVSLLRWRFEMDSALGESWLRRLLAEYLNGTACERLPYDVLAADAELVAAVRLGDRGDADWSARIELDIDDDADSYSPRYRPPEYLEALDSLAVPPDAWERIVGRLGPVWQGGRYLCVS